MHKTLSRLALGTLAATALVGTGTAQTTSQFHGHSALPAATAQPVHISTMQPHTVGARVDVDLDRTSVVRLPASASAVVVGNPSIADIAVHSTDTLLVLGRSYGSTNILAMDAVGRIISDTTVHVGASRGRSSVRVFEGADSRKTYACEPHCLPAPQLGDNPEHIAIYRPAAPQINDQFVAQGGLGAPAGLAAQPVPSFAPSSPTFVPSVPVPPQMSDMPDDFAPSFSPPSASRSASTPFSEGSGSGRSR